MTAFLPSPPLPHQPKRLNYKPILCQLSSLPLNPLPVDPLPAFEAFCHRTKTTLHTQTANADGLTTFTTPFSYPPTHTTTKDTATGRRFRAHINVFRSPPYKHQSAGLALKLVPHDPTLPSLRADVHYFQTASSWWFSGACDLSAGPAGGLGTYSDTFLRRWQLLRDRYRVRDANRQTSFLDVCYASVDRETAFGFVGEVVEALLPAYLPLLLEKGEGAVEEGELLESFCIHGGAACESSTLRREPFVSWSFSLAPSALTAAGRVYDTLREGCYPDLYIVR